MAKRTNKQIAKDYILIRDAIKDCVDTTLKDFALGLGKTESEIRTTLLKHPIVKSRLMRTLMENKEKQKVKFEKSYVIDASIVGTEEFDEYIKTKKHFILTSVTIRELESLSRFKDVHGTIARRLLAMAVENPGKFSNVLIEEEGLIPDNAIVQYCAKNKDKVVLLTADKTMVLNSRMYEFEVEYLKHIQKTCSRKNTLFIAQKEGEKLLINSFITPYRKTMVISNNGHEVLCGPYELNIGDEVFVATKKKEKERDVFYLTFAHYKMNSLEHENNCNVIFWTRVYEAHEIEALYDERYKSFMRNFKNRVGL